MDNEFEPWGTDGYTFMYKGHRCVSFRAYYVESASYRFAVVSSSKLLGRILYVGNDLSSQAELVEVFGPDLAAKLMSLLYIAKDTKNG